MTLSEETMGFWHKWHSAKVRVLTFSNGTWLGPAASCLTPSAPPPHSTKCSSRSVSELNTRTGQSSHLCLKYRKLFMWNMLGYVRWTRESFWVAILNFWKIWYKTWVPWWFQVIGSKYAPKLGAPRQAFFGRFSAVKTKSSWQNLEFFWKFLEFIRKNGFFLKYSRFCQLDLVFTADKRPKKASVLYFLLLRQDYHFDLFSTMCVSGLTYQ